MQKSSLNKVTLIGHVGNKPEGRYTPSGMSTVSFSVATNETWIDQDEKRQNHTEWHNIVAWNKIADFITQYVDKGSLIYVEGRLRTSTWTDKEKHVRKSTEILCDVITPLVWKTKVDDKTEKVSDKIETDNGEDLPF